ncbi:MAG: DUF3417 domain-containing protein, partial [Acidimicrobiia bacterium]
MTNLRRFPDLRERAVPPEIPVVNHLDYPVPRSLERLVDLAHNMWWAWNAAGADLWAALDPDQWELTHNPLDIIRSTEPHRWTELEQIETV